ncbi:DUF7373 family lipoprotein [Nocardia stercoris]|uniref:Uncharacterized protein n=1 Tax=Nocardia stercoris TaxID=2483361 RepID=A0A3M2L4C3_9NOCA|nr:hypothetical protein [Nocardia stercoris]RMI31826.1 hypothetical protein EBN03_16760 [Nocardia stercoris]
MRRSSGALAALVLVAGLVTAGCGSHGGAATPAEAAVDLSTLDVGPYKAEPGTWDKPRNTAQAIAMEAERLGNVVPLPSDIDPAFQYIGAQNSLVLTDDIKGSVISDFWKDDHFAEDGPGYAGGFATYARDDAHNNGTELLNAVLIFGTPDQAAAAATAYQARAFAAPATDGLGDTPDPAQPANEVVPIAKYPGAHAHWRPGQQAIFSWFAFRNFVVFTSVYGQDAIALHHADRAVLIDLVTHSLDAESAALQNYNSTPPDKLTDQPMDPDGMLNRTLERPKAATGEWVNPPGVYNARAALNFTDDQKGDKVWFERDGVDRFSDYGTRLYRTRDAAAALDARDELGGGSKHFKPSEAPKNLPAAICREYRGKELGTIRYYCAVNYGRYAAMSWSDQLLDAQQRISAQYAILVKAK